MQLNEIAASRDFIGEFVRGPLPESPVRPTLVALLEGAELAAVGQEVILGFALPGTKQLLTARAEVLRKEVQGRIAVQFRELGVEEQKAIAKFISGGITD